MRRHKIILALSLCAGLTSALFTAGILADELEDAMSGFDDFDKPATSTPATTAKEDSGDDLSDLDESGFGDSDLDDSSSGDHYIGNAADRDIDTKADWYTISGYTSLLGAYNYAQSDQSVVAPGDMPMDFSGLSRARVKGGLTLEMKHGDNWRSKFDVMAWYDASWAINGRDGYTQDVLDTYESFYDLKDAYIQGSLNRSLDLKFGRQVVIWGKSDSIRITDIINPLDNREPGMVDIEDLRLSETMTRMDYYFGHWGLSAIIIHEPRLEIEPAFGSDYRPSDVFGTPIPYARFPDRTEPSWSTDNTQYAMSLDGHFTGWDLSLYAANVFDNRFDIEIINTAAVRYYDKINMLGFAGNVVSGSWLFKAESAFINDINYRSTDRKNRLDLLIGFDYMGIKDTVLSLELADRHIFDYEEHMLTLTLEQAALQGTIPDFVRQDSLQLAFRSSYSFDHDNATVTYLLSLAGGNGAGDSFDGGFQRLWIDYKYTDAISLDAGIVDYIGGNSLIPFYQA
ncbi:MAG: DUF1302 family protein, partial [Proteobacteria bacterium]|nr:DUF1302 family protein [Pseudomonadota bacterium]